MSHIDRLVEQHIRESELHLKHIDEMMQKAVEAKRRSQVGGSPDLAMVERDRMRLAQELHGLRNAPRPASEEVAERSKGLKAMLQSVGAEFEKALVAVVDQNKH
ncbi:MAG: hypothetical protein ABJA49_02715 [Betaproteobacteria bacterium]